MLEYPQDRVFRQTSSLFQLQGNQMLTLKEGLTIFETTETQLLGLLDDYDCNSVLCSDGTEYLVSRMG